MNSANAKIDPARRNTDEDSGINNWTKTSPLGAKVQHSVLTVMIAASSLKSSTSAAVFSLRTVVFLE